MNEKRGFFRDNGLSLVLPSNARSPRARIREAFTRRR